MTKKDEAMIDEVLYDSLLPDILPEHALNQKVLKKREEILTMGRNRERKTGNYRFVAAVAAVILAFSSVTAYAAWKYLSPSEIADEFSDKKLSEEFAARTELEAVETQESGGYEISLLGIVSGDRISDFLMKDDKGEIKGDRTYIAVAIRKADGSPMPDVQDDDYNPSELLVSPYIKGLNPVTYNAFTLNGGFSGFVKDGVQYRILETDNVEAFADKGVYVGVSDGMTYHREAFDFDEKSGELRKNEKYDGVNALFALSLDPAKADPERAEEILKSIEAGDGEADTESEADTDTGFQKWFNKLTPENIEEYAVPLEDSRQVLKPYKSGNVSYSYKAFDAETTGTFSAKELFKNKEKGEFVIFGGSEGGNAGEFFAETCRLNEDGTVTFLVYVPKEK